MSIEEYLQFRTLAKTHATVINSGKSTEEGGVSSTPVQRLAVKRKRTTDYFKSDVPPKELSKIVEVDRNYKTECLDKDGFERRLVSDYDGWRFIKLDTVYLSVNPSEVATLAESIARRFDITQAVLIVSQYVEGEKNEYRVVHGHHRLSAFKSLDAAKKFDGLSGIVDRKIPRYVIGAGCRDELALGVYYQIR